MAWLGVQCGSCCGMGLTETMAGDMGPTETSSQDAEQGLACPSPELTPQVIVMGPQEKDQAAPNSLALYGK